MDHFCWSLIFSEICNRTDLINLCLVCKDWNQLVNADAHIRMHKYASFSHCIAKRDIGAAKLWFAQMMNLMGIAFLSTEKYECMIKACIKYDIPEFFDIVVAPLIYPYYKVFICFPFFESRVTLKSLIEKHPHGKSFVGMHFGLMMNVVVSKRCEDYGIYILELVAKHNISIGNNEKYCYGAAINDLFVLFCGYVKAGFYIPVGEYGGLNVKYLKFINDLGYPIANNSAVFAVGNNAFETLEFLWDIGNVQMQTLSALCGTAVNYGALDCLMFLCAHGALCDANTFSIAISSGNLHCAKYLLDIRCPHYKIDIVRFRERYIDPPPHGKNA